jgi:hypothetical protein
MTTWIAEEHVVLVAPDGRRTSGRIAVGLPVQLDATEATCDIVLDGWTRPLAVHGASPLQALLLAVQMLGMTLHDFVAKGGRVLSADDQSQVPLEAFFGPLLRPV